jgi:repressor LexA
MGRKEKERKMKRHQNKRHSLEEMLAYIDRYRREHGYSPSMREIGRALGHPSLSTVAYGLAQLEEAGRIRRDYGVSRSIVVVVPPARERVP